MGTPVSGKERFARNLEQVHGLSHGALYIADHHEMKSEAERLEFQNKCALERTEREKAWRAKHDRAHQEREREWEAKQAHKNAAAPVQPMYKPVSMAELDFVTKQRAEEKAVEYLSNTPHLGDKQVSYVKWPTQDPTLWSEKHDSYIVHRPEMHGAIESGVWLPRGLNPVEVQALLCVLSRPIKPPVGAAKIARPEHRRQRGFDRPSAAGVAKPVSRKQKLITSVLG
jgi:hypothetical protein